MPTDIFHDHDRIIDQNPNREDQRKEGNAIEGKSIKDKAGKGQSQSNGNRHCNHHRLFATHRKPHQQRYRTDRN